MNWYEIVIIIACLAIVFGVALASLFRKKKNKKNGCCGCCSDCSGCQEYKKFMEKAQNEDKNQQI